MGAFADIKIELSFRGINPYYFPVFVWYNPISIFLLELSVDFFPIVYGITIFLVTYAIVRYQECSFDSTVMFANH